MPISLRIPPETEARLSELAKEKDKTKTSLILEALEEKYLINKDRARLIRETAGWMSKSECDELRRAVSAFDAVEPTDWP